VSGFGEYDNFDALGLAALVSSGQVKAEELLDEAITRCERVNGVLNAIVHRHDEEARRDLERLPPGAPFAGVPFLLKNLGIALRDTVTSCGSRAFANDIADHNSTLVTRYRSAGLIMFGKTNTPELGLMPVTEPTLHGPTRNPWDLGRTPGGSSGGAAAAVAAGIVPMAHASDGGGSIRIPAACTGLVGFKPSRGRMPSGPNQGEGWAGLSVHHALTRSVRDSAALLDACAGPEPGDPYAAPAQRGSFQQALAHAPRRLRIALGTHKWGYGDYTSAQREQLHATAAVLTELGHEVEEAMPAFDFEQLAHAMYSVMAVQTASELQRRADTLGCAPEELPLEEHTRRLFSAGSAISATRYADAIHCQQLAGRALGAFHLDYDVILAPTLCSDTPPELGALQQLDGDTYAQRLADFIGDTAVFNQTGQPSLSLPVTWAPDGRPAGMMFSAAYGEDALLLRLARQLELARPWWSKRPPVHAGLQQ